MGNSGSDELLLKASDVTFTYELEPRDRLTTRDDGDRFCKNAPLAFCEEHVKRGRLADFDAGTETPNARNSQIYGII